MIRYRMPHKIGSEEPTVNSPLLTVKAAAALIEMSEAWLRQSDIPKVKLGRVNRYRRSDIDRYVDAHVSHALVREAE